MRRGRRPADYRRVEHRRGTDAVTPGLRALQIAVGVLGARGKVGAEVCSAVTTADDLDLVNWEKSGDGHVCQTTT